MRKLIAKILFWFGFRPRCSTDVCGRFTRGYGKLDHNGFWQFQLPYRPEDMEDVI